MGPVTATPLDAPAEPDLDENGVDLAQVRAMLDLAPADRLSRVAEFINALVALRPPPMPPLAPMEILRLLAARRVEFIVVGMAAGVLRGAPVTTLDLDIVHRRT